MASRGQSITVTYKAWDVVNNVGKTGDVANHTLRWIKDGTSSAPTNSPSEVDATNLPGVYKLVLTTAECTCDYGVLGGKSSTANIIIIEVAIDFEQLPTAAPNTNLGLPIVDSTLGVKLQDLFSPVAHTGTAQSGSASDITLAAGASSTNDLYTGMLLAIISGTGAGQVRRIVTYVGSTKIASIDWNWTTNPDATSVYAVLRNAGPRVNNSLQVQASVCALVSALATNCITATAIQDGAFDKTAFSTDTALVPSRTGTAQAGASNSITLDAGASAVTDFYVGSIVYLTGNTGAGQARIVIAYNGTSKVATVNRAWATNPSGTTTFVIIPSDSPAVNSSLQIIASGFAADSVNAAALATDAVAEIQSGLATSANQTTILNRLPAALVSGRMDASVGAMIADVLTASALASDAVAEIQSGLGTAAAQTNILNRLPASLVGGRIDASVGAVVTDALTAAALAADAVVEIQNGLATLANQTSILNRLPAALVGGKIDANLGSDAVNASVLSSDAVAEIQSGLATVANQNTILARLGAWTGSGLNTILGALRALAAKAASLTPTDISTGTAYDNTTDSQEAIRDNLGGGGGGGSSVLYGSDGPIQFGILIDDGDGAAIEGASVRISPDSLGTNKSDARITDSSGRCYFNGYSGTTVYAWVSHPRHTFTNPMTIAIS